MTTLAPLWWEGRSPAASELPPTDGVPQTADVVIVGGGLTGLWTAYYLTQVAPHLSVVVLEAEFCGFGASGRNGGWVSSLWPVGAATIAAESGVESAQALVAALQETVREVGRVADAEGIACDYVRGGTIVLARNAAQASRAHAEAASDDFGTGTVWVGEQEARAYLDASGVRGATVNPHCARIDPRALVDGLVRTIRAAGVLVCEGVAVETASPGVVTYTRSEHGGVGVLRAGHVIRATEAFTARFPELHRRIAPVYSLMVATEPLPTSVWDEIGLRERQTFSDHRHVIVYGQRTADDRIAFGGRGAPYHLRSSIHPHFDHDETVFAELRRTLREMLPQLGDAAFTHAWGGPLGIARDWHPSVGYDADARVGWAGGYVGDGVAATNLAGRTLADLVAGQASSITRLPWVGHRSPDWEPEPARWLGINVGLRLAHLADLEEARTGRPARLGRALTSLTGH